MIIFHIPSWYPSRTHPYSGIFIKEFIEGYATEFPESMNIVSNHLENYYPISLKQPLHSFKNIRNFIKEKKTIIPLQRKSNLIELYTTKVLGLSPNIFAFKKNELKKIHLKNLEYCIEKYGKPDIIHSYITFPAGEIAYALSNKYKIPYIITEHLGQFVPPEMLVNGKLPAEMLNTLMNASAVICVSNSQSKQSKEFIDRTVLVIPNGINENLFYPNNCNLKEDSGFRFLTVSSTLHNSKGIDTLIKSIKICNENGILAKYKIGGSEKYLSEAKAMAKDNDIDNIEWFGILSREEISKEMKDCQAFVLPSRHESFGVVYAEAIACGKPVIATSCGGPEDIVNDKNGILVPVDDVNALANAMGTLIKNYKQYDPIVIRQDFLDRFSTKVVATKYNHLYSTIVKP